MAKASIFFWFATFMLYMAYILLNSCSLHKIAAIIGISAIVSFGIAFGCTMLILPPGHCSSL